MVANSGPFRLPPPQLRLPRRARRPRARRRRASASAAWCDIRLALVEREELAVRNGEVSALEQDEQSRLRRARAARRLPGLRVRLRPDRRPRSQRVAARCAVRAREGRPPRGARPAPRWADEPAWRDRWSSTWLIDPFTVPLDRKLDLLHARRRRAAREAGDHRHELHRCPSAARRRPSCSVGGRASTRWCCAAARASRPRRTRTARRRRAAIRPRSAGSTLAVGWELVDVARPRRPRGAGAATRPSRC